MLIQSSELNKHELWPVNLQEFEVNLHCCQKKESLNHHTVTTTTQTTTENYKRQSEIQMMVQTWLPSPVPFGSSCLSVIHWIFWLYMNCACTSYVYVCSLFPLSLSWFDTYQCFFFHRTCHPLCFLDHLRRLHSNQRQHNHLSPSSAVLLLSSQWFHNLCNSLNLRTTCVFHKKKNSIKVERIVLLCSE